MPDDGPRLVSVALDAAESELVQELADAGEMPFLQAMIDRGRWTKVESTVSIGSSSIWFTLWTGQHPNEHGRYGEWRWLPDKMEAQHSTGDGLQPFWAELADRGLRIGIFDVPFAPQLEADGFQVSEWGGHEVETGHTHISPQGPADLLASMPSHPYKGAPPQVGGPEDHSGLRHAGRSAMEGISLRSTTVRRLLGEYDPHFSMIVFPELHDAGHVLWHTLHPDHPVYESAGIRVPPDTPTIRDLYRHADEQLAKLYDSLPNDASFCLFSLDGMRPGRGVPTFHSRVVELLGLSSPATWRTLDSRQKLTRLFAAAKRTAPGWLRNIYRDRIGKDVRLRLASSTMMEQYDWSTTKAFIPPCDQHGWVRMNLAGREREGIMTLDEYEQVLDEIEARIRELSTEDGRLLAEEILRPGKDGYDPSTLSIPDLIVHWGLAAHEHEVSLSDARYSAPPIGAHRTGQHSMNAFCLSVGPVSNLMPDVIDISNLHHVFLSGVGSQGSGLS